MVLTFKREPQTANLTARHWSHDFLTFAVRGICRKTSILRSLIADNNGRGDYDEGGGGGGRNIYSPPPRHIPLDLFSLLSILKNFNEFLIVYYNEKINNITFTSTTTASNSITGATTNSNCSWKGGFFIRPLILYSNCPTGSFLYICRNTVTNSFSKDSVRSFRLKKISSSQSLIVVSTRNDSRLRIISKF